jgi:hypothetical protein
MLVGCSVVACMHACSNSVDPKSMHLLFLKYTSGIDKQLTLMCGGLYVGCWAGAPLRLFFTATEMCPFAAFSLILGWQHAETRA